MGRVAHQLHWPLFRVGELPLEDYLDEVDATGYFADLDNPPEQEKPR